MKLKYIFTLILVFIGFTACDNVLEDVDFNVTLNESNMYTAGSDVVFNLTGSPNWVTFYSGEDKKGYPEGGVAIKNITNSLSTYSYKFAKPGTYVVVFMAGNENYQGEKSVKREVTVTIN